MTPIVRIFDGETAAQTAATKLAEAGYGDQQVVNGASAAGSEASIVDAAVESGAIDAGQREQCIGALRQGRSLVMVRAPFGAAEDALAILHANGAMAAPDVPARDPAPLSDVLGIPTLSHIKPSVVLIENSWSFSKDYLFGMPLLSKKAAPLSSMFGMKTVSAGKSKTSLSNKATPLSSMFGMRVLSKNKGSSGSRSMSRNPAPLSSLFGMPTLTKKQ